MGAASFCVLAEDGTFRPTSDLQANNSWLDAQWWVDGTVATGVGATATLSPGALCRFTADRDGWTLGHFRQTNGDVYLYPGAGAWLTMDAGSGAVSEMATTSFKFGANVRYRSPLRLTGSGALFFGSNVFERGSWPILGVAREFYLKSGDVPFGEASGVLDDGAEGVGSIEIDGSAENAFGVSHGALDYHATRPFGGGFYTRHGRFTYRPSAWPVETAAPVPSALPAGCILHLDASVEASLVRTDGSSLLAKWKDLSGSGNDAVTVGDARMPPEIWEREVAGKTVVSFGGYYGNSANLRAHMTFTKPVSLAKKTVFWVVGSAHGGGSLLGNAAADARVFQRGGSGGMSESDPLLKEARDGLTFRVNGEAVDPTTTGLSGGYDIVTLVDANETDGDFAGLACDLVGTAQMADGHQSLAEFLVFDGVLDEDQIRGVEAFLADKWLKGRTDIRRHYVIGTEVFEVAASDRTPVIQELQGPGSFVKAGAGSVRIEKPFGFGGDIKLVGGTLAFGARRPEMRLDAARELPTDGLILRFDASDAATLDVTNGFVRAWRDKAAGIVADSSAEGAKAPFYSRHTVNGRPGVDFGEIGSGRFIQFAPLLEEARTVMVVGDSRRGGGYYISNSAAGNVFERNAGGINSLASGFRQTAAFFNSAVFNMVYLNGHSVPSDRTHPQGGPEIFTVLSPEKTLKIDRIGKDRNFADRSGGQVIGEYLVWNRSLSPAERLAAEAYLHDKWLKGSPDVKGLRVEGNVTLQTDGDITVGGLDGPGTLTKTGRGVLTVETVGLEFDVTRLNVVEGSVVIRAKASEAPVELPVADPLIWTDASNESSFTCDGDEVTAWADVRGNGWIATSTKVSNQRLYRKELNGRTVLDTADTNAGRFKWPSAQRGLRNIFFVKGSIPRVNNQNGGSLLAWEDGIRGWGRDNYSVRFGASILSVALGSVVQEGLRGRFWLGGVQVSPFTTGYNGGYQLVSVEAAGEPIYADSFANGQQIAEFIAYDRDLTDEERQAVEAYLARKWFGKGLHGYVVPDEALPGRALAANERMALAPAAGETNRVGWVAGTGTLVKEGDGVLSLVGSTAGFDGRLDIRAGEVVYGTPKYAGAIPQIAGLVARFDAARAESFTFYEGADAAVIKSWTDVDGRYTATNCWYSSGRKELRLTDGGANGLSAVVFGAYGRTSSLHLMETIPGVKAVFAVLGTQEGTGAFIEDAGASWHPGFQKGWGSVESGVFNGDFADWLRVNGEGPYNSNAIGILKPDAYQVLGVQRRSPAPIDMFGSDRHIDNGGREGGFRIGELIFVSQAVGDEARLDIEAYLGHKWLAAPITNRNYMAAGTARAGTLAIVPGAVFDLNGFTQTVDALTGGGTVKGDLTLAAGAVWSFAPGETLQVTGTLTLPRKGIVRPRGGIGLASEGTFKIAEAGAFAFPRGLSSWRTVETDANGIRWVTRIAVSGNAVYATHGRSGGFVMTIR